MRKKKLLLKGLILGVLIFLVFNLLIPLFIIWQGWRIVRSVQPPDLDTIGNAVYQIRVARKIYQLTSLGTYRLEPSNTVDQVLLSVIDLIEATLAMAEQSKTLMASAVSGEGANIAEWNQWFGNLERSRISMQHISDQMVSMFNYHPLSKYFIKAGVKPGLFIPQINELNELILLKTDLMKVLGYESPQHYILLLQNNTEIRPTGGFMGSYAEFWLDQGAMRDLKIEDIYIPDGQIPGYVEPPQALTDYLREGDRPGWRLRDSNWDPDFPTAAQTIEWFLVEGGHEPIDGMIAVTLPPMLDLVKIAGPIELPDYQVTVDQDNLYEVTQREVQENFFPGSYQKTAFMSKLGQAVLQKVKAGEADFSAYAPLLLAQLKKRNVLITVENEAVAAWLKAKKWDGSLARPQCSGDNCLVDYVYIVDANVGSTKANCCLERDLTHEMLVARGVLTHTIKQQIKNNNPVLPEPPHEWGGGYKNYQRILLSPEATNIKVVVDGEELDSEAIDIEGLGVYTSVGFLHLVEGTQTGTSQVSYELPLGDTTAHLLYFQKQPGVESYPVTLQWQDQTETVPFETDIERHYPY